MALELMDQATLSALVQAAGLAVIAGITKRADMKRESARADTDAKRKAEAEWREGIEHRMDDHDKKLRAVLKGQTTQMRSDLVHKAHRYLDDLGCASTEEKQAFHAEYEDYCAICKAHEIENSFVDSLAEQVMDLPNRS